MYLLQDVFFQSSGDRYPWIGPVVMIVLGGVFLFFLIRNLKKNRKGASASSLLSVFAMYKIAGSYGLNTHQKKALENVFREDSVADPFLALQNAPLLDKHFKHAYQRIKDSPIDEATAQQQIALLFSTRNAIEAVQNTTATTTGAAKAVSSTHQIHRKYRRRKISLPCTLAMIIVREVTVHRKLVRKLSLDGRRFTGDIMDLSIGGCSVRTAATIEPGARVKLEFQQGKSASMAALAQVLRVNRAGIHATIHMKFSKIPQRTQNSINALVFEYGEG